MNELEMIRELAAGFPRSADQANALFECDSELVTIGGKTWALTMDDFSPEEDRFPLDLPELLGANLATATLSDLLAAGADPAFFMHAVSLPRSITGPVLRQLAEGIRSVLEQAGCALIGGDTGVADTWRYCGFAMGPVAGRPLTRRLPDLPQSLWVTGRLGDANVAALRRAPPPRFELRLAESRAVRQRATACMDTSGGLMDALWTFHVLNPGLRFDLHLETVPLAPEVPAFARSAGLPPEAALLGGAGEYELLVAAPLMMDKAEAAEWARLGLTRIGEAIPWDGGDIGLHREGKRVSAMTQPPPCPRAAGSLDEYIGEVGRMAAALFGRAG
jgi:thiamine-monophosphate kinase